MGVKRIEMKEGFFLLGEEIVECHFREVEQKERFYENTESYLVVYGDVFTFSPIRDRKVFDNYEKAGMVRHQEKMSSAEFYRNQITQYNERLLKITGETE